MHTGLQVKDLHTFLRDDERFDGKHGWDCSVYPEAGSDREQLLGMVGCCKAKDGDYRVLEPMGPEHPYHAYIVQCLTGSEESLEPRDPSTPIVARANRRSRRPGKPDWLSLPEGELVVLAMQGMCGKGMVSGYRPGVLKNNLLPFETTGERACCHGGSHDSNTCGVTFRRDGAILYHCNSESHCELDPPVIGCWRRSLASRMSEDALLPDQASKFDPSLVQALEREVWAEMPEAKKLASCPSYCIYVKFVIQYYNRFFVHVLSGKPEIVQFDLDDDGVPVSFERRTFASTRETTLHAGSSFDIWVKDAAKETRTGFFAHPDPDHAIPGQVNMCVGSFPMARACKEPLTELELARLKPILRAFEVDICRDEAVQYEYVFNWLAYPLQQLGRKNNTAILVFGAQGMRLSRLCLRFCSKLFTKSAISSALSVRSFRAANIEAPTANMTAKLATTLILTIITSIVTMSQVWGKLFCSVT